MSIAGGGVDAAVGGDAAGVDDGCAGGLGNDDGG